MEIRTTLTHIADAHFAVSQTLRQFPKGLGFAEVFKNAEEASVENTKDGDTPKQPEITAFEATELQKIFAESPFKHAKGNKLIVSNHGGQRHREHQKHCQIHGTGKRLGHTKDDNHGAGGKKAGTTDNYCIGYITKHKDEKCVTFSGLLQKDFQICQCLFVKNTAGAGDEHFPTLHYEDFKKYCPNLYETVKNYDGHFTITILGGEELDSDCKNGNQINVVGAKGEQQDVQTYIANNFLRCAVNPKVSSTSKQVNGKTLGGFLDCANTVAEKHPDTVCYEAVNFDDPTYGKGTIHYVLNPKTDKQTFKIQATTGIRGSFSSGLSQKNMICSKVDLGHWARTVAPMLGIMINKSDFVFYVELEDRAIYHNMDRTGLIQDVEGEQHELKFTDFVDVISKHLPKKFRDIINDNYKMESSDSFNELIAELEKKIESPEKAEYTTYSKTKSSKQKSGGKMRFRSSDDLESNYTLKKSRGGLFNKENPMVDISINRDNEIYELDARYVVEYNNATGIVSYDSSGAAWQIVMKKVFSRLEDYDFDAHANQVYVKAVYEELATIVINCHNMFVGKELTWNRDDNENAWSKEALSSYMFKLPDDAGFLRKLKIALKKDQDNRVNS